MFQSNFNHSPQMSSCVPRNINKHLSQDTWLSTLIAIAQQAQYEEVSPNVLDILFPVLFMFRAWQKQTNTPFGKNMLLEKEQLDLETLTSNIVSTRQTLW